MIYALAKVFYNFRQKNGHQAEKGKLSSLAVCLWSTYDDIFKREFTFFFLQ